MDAWLTVASPETTLPSSGMRLPVRTIIRSPGFTSPMGTSSSVSPDCSHTLSTFSAIAPARSATDFLCVHSSRISPSRSMNMTEPAVSKSPRTIETVTAVASSTATESLPCSRALSPARMYLTERNSAMAICTGTGRNSRENARRQTVKTSLSSYSRLSARDVCSGRRASARSDVNEKDESARTISARGQV